MPRRDDFRAPDRLQGQAPDQGRGSARREDERRPAGPPGSYNSDTARYGSAQEDDPRRYRPDGEARYFAPAFGEQEFHGYAGQEYGLESHDPRGRRSLLDDVRRQARTGAVQHGQSEMSWGGQGGGYGGAGPGGASIADPDPVERRDSPGRRPRDETLDPRYLAWRDQQMRAHDDDYARWREAQRRRYDDDYRAWVRDKGRSAAPPRPGRGGR